jgi:hypothetical protein
MQVSEWHYFLKHSRFFIMFLTHLPYETWVFLHQTKRFPSESASKTPKEKKKIPFFRNTFKYTVEHGTSAERITPTLLKICFFAAGTKFNLS